MRARACEIKRSFGADQSCKSGEGAKPSTSIRVDFEEQRPLEGPLAAKKREKAGEKCKGECIRRPKVGRRLGREMGKRREEKFGLLQGCGMESTDGVPSGRFLPCQSEVWATVQLLVTGCGGRKIRSIGVWDQCC